MILELLYPEIPEDSRIAIFTLPERLSTYHKTAKEAHRAAEEASDRNQNAYFCVGLQPPGLGAHTRARATEVVGIPGLWLDLDVAGDGHQKRGYLPSIEAAREFLAGLPHPPSLLVETGGGLHVYWIFKEPWIFDTDEEREEAQAIVRGWNQFLKSSAKAKGYEIDSTFDLARVLRVDGTINHKYGNEVRILEELEHRYNPSDFSAWAQHESDPYEVAVDPIVVDTEVDVGAEMLAGLFELGPLVKKTWENRRTDLPSASENELALANWAASVNWTDQEIASMLIAWRVRHKLKVKHQGYYERTIRLARTSDLVKGIQEDLEEDAPLPDDPVEREKRIGELLQVVRLKTNLRVTKIVAYGGGEDRQYVLCLAERDPILLGDVAGFCNQLKWQRAAVLAGLGSFRKSKPKDWESVISAATQVTEVIATPETDPKGIVLDWLRDLSRGASHISGPEARHDVIVEGMQFIEDGKFYFTFASLFQKIRLEGEKFGRADLQRRLAAVAGPSSLIRARKAGEPRAQRRYYSVAVPTVEDRASFIVAEVESHSGISEKASS